MFREDIKKAAEENGIQFLLHFTRADNLDSIFRYGILSVSKQKSMGFEVKRNDQNRHDYFLNATSTSIHLPNNILLYKYKNQFNCDWVIIGIKPDIIWEKRCGFCFENAANSKFSKIPLNKRMSVEALNGMFKNINGKPPRDKLNINKSLTTSPQAEVLVFEDIEPSYIWGIAYESNRSKNKYKDNIPNSIKLEVVQELFLFDVRPDSKYW
ncbi:DarT ssDNA thymidine ADP-ribosyltransferase family protein [Virgibacillus proomii]|uniref:DarT ssDNA thymidine ADP-ribosyltransferase family protein n=1 Tax=Virgibacillus proomii TaxID=84407 RepID=UPI0015C2C8F8|nr:DarT ssDNA thymidine ADP-ribosyltransferase family protein [Virgibacillus proomii]